LGVIFSQDLLTGVTEDIPLCVEEGSMVEIRAGLRVTSGQFRS
jgi:hypothetical protein